MGTAEVVAILRANTSQFTAEMGKADAQVAQISKAGGSNFEKMGAVGKVALLGIAGAAVGGGVAAVDLGMKYEDAHRRLTTAVKAAGESMTPYQSQLDKTQQRMQQLGFTNTDVQNALGYGVVATKDMGKSMSELGTAADLARFKHISLDDAMQLLTRAVSGNSRVLKSMGIDLAIPASSAEKVKVAQQGLTKATEAANAILAKTPDAANPASKAHAAYEQALGKVATATAHVKDLQSSHTIILAELSKRLGGQAADAANTFSGRMQTLKVTGENLGAHIGEKLIPILEKMGTQISQVVTWLEKHKVVAEALAVAVGTVLTAAIAAYIAKITLAAVENVVQFAKMTVSVVTWIAANLAGLVQLGVAWTVYTVRWLAENVAAFATFVAEHAAMAAAFVVQNLLMIASATAAFIAENAATLGIVAGIALLVGGIIYLATHWSQVWTDIKTWVAEGADWVRKHFYIIMAIPFVGWIIELAANWRMVWDMIKATIALAWSIIQPIFNLIKTVGIDYIAVSVAVLQTVWNGAWSAISAAVKFSWENVIKPAWDLMKSGIIAVQTVIGALQTAWNGAWSGIGSVISAIWENVIKPVISAITTGVNAAKTAVNDLKNAAGTVAKVAANPVGALGSALGFADGGQPPVGVPSIVGERGPELFVPQGAGTIIPNNALGGGGSNQPINVTLQIDGQTLAQVLLTNQLRMKRTGGYGSLGLA